RGRAAALHGCGLGQRRPGDGAARSAADRLWRQCAHHDGRPRHARPADADLTGAMTITSYVTPLTAGSVAARNSGDLFVGLRRELDELQRQLTTGERAQSYGGLGFERGASLDARAKISALDSYDTAIQSAELRTNLITKGLEQLQGSASDVTSTLLPPKFDIDLDGRTSAPKDA